MNVNHGLRSRAVSLLGVTGFILFSTTNVLAGETLKDLEREIRVLIDSSKSSVVTVSARFSSDAPAKKDNGILSFFKTESPQAPVSFMNIGSGIIFNKDGYILTRSSIVVGAELISVRLSSGDDIKAEFVGQDPETGFAIIKVKHKSLKPAKLGNSDTVVPGDWNLLIGNSLGVYPSVTFGTVNGLRKDGMLQISADLNPGNNGNPIINSDGEVIGLIAGLLNTFDEFSLYRIDQKSHLTTLAYPINWIKRIADDIIQYGYLRKGWMGVVGYYDRWTPEIREIKQNSPAQKAGLTKGDIIVRFAAKQVKTIAELARLVEYSFPGEEVDLQYLRAGKLFDTTLKIGERKQPDDPVRQFSNRAAVVGTPSLKDINERNLLIGRRIEQLEKELLQLKKMMNSK